MTHPHINISRPRRHFSRTAAGPRTLCTYGLVDDISLSWKGPRLDRADDNAEDCTLSIATDFSEKARRDGEYAYDPDGRLTRDSNKGVTISYNILGLPSLVCDGVNRIRRTYDSQGTLLRAEYGTERIEFTSPEPGQAGAIVATPVFDLARVADRCGPVEYADHTVERYIHEAGWIDSHGRHVAAVRDCRGSLRATWTAHSALPPAPGNGSNNTNGNPSASGNNGSSLTLPGQGIGQVLPAGNVYADLTAYYPFGLPFADWQGASRDLFSGKELERSGNLLDYDFHARRLDPQLLIFDKPDPLAATYPHLNPYLYCAANPVSLTDPSGKLIYYDSGTTEGQIAELHRIYHSSKMASYIFNYVQNSPLKVLVKFEPVISQDTGEEIGGKVTVNEPESDYNFTMSINSNPEKQSSQASMEELCHVFQLMFPNRDYNENMEFEAKNMTVAAFAESAEGIFIYYTPNESYWDNIYLNNTLNYDNVTTPSFEQLYINEGNAFRKLYQHLNEQSPYRVPVTKIPNSLLYLLKNYNTSK